VPCEPDPPGRARLASDHRRPRRRRRHPGAGGESVHPRSAAKRCAARSYLRIDRRPAAVLYPARGGAVYARGVRAPAARPGRALAPTQPSSRPYDRRRTQQ